jgi:hypothetical protein
MIKAIGVHIVGSPWCAAVASARRLTPKRRSELAVDIGGRCTKIRQLSGREIGQGLFFADPPAPQPQQSHASREGSFTPPAGLPGGGGWLTIYQERVGEPGHELLLGKGALAEKWRANPVMTKDTLSGFT